MLDLIFDYPIIFGVIIYFIWTLFKPSKAEKQPPKRPQAHMPYEESPYEAERSYEVKPVVQQPAPVKQAPARPKVTLTTSHSSETVNYNYELEKARLEERKNKAEQAKRALQQGATQMPSKTASSRSYGSLHQQLKQPTRQQLREGILWAEILSKPKAKRHSIK